MVESLYVSSEPLMILYNTAQREDYELINDCSEKWLTAQIKKMKTNLHFIPELPPLQSCELL